MTKPIFVPRNILCAVDMGPISSTILKWARLISGAYDSHRHLFHACRQGFFANGFVAEALYRTVGASIFWSSSESYSLALDEDNPEVSNGTARLGSRSTLSPAWFVSSPSPTSKLATDVLTKSCRDPNASTNPVPLIQQTYFIVDLPEWRLLGP